MDFIPIRNKMLTDRLPLEIVRYIYSYDSTYLEYFRKYVMHDLMEEAWRRIFTDMMEDAEISLFLIGYLSDDSDDNDIYDELHHYIL